MVSTATKGTATAIETLAAAGMKAAARAVFMKAVVRCTAAVGAVLTVEADTAVKARSHGAGRRESNDYPCGGVLTNRSKWLVLRTNCILNKPFAAKYHSAIDFPERVFQFIPRSIFNKIPVAPRSFTPFP